MTISDYKEQKEREIIVMEDRLRGIIETESDHIDPMADGALETLSDNGRLLASPVLMRKAAERFHELFWDNEQIRELEIDKAYQAIDETMKKNPSQDSFSIIREGKQIALTKGEIEAIRLSFIRDEIAGYLAAWEDNLVYQAASAVETGESNEDTKEANKLLEVLQDKSNREKILASFSESMMDSLLPFIGEDDAINESYNQMLDDLFRPLAKQLVKENE